MDVLSWSVAILAVITILALIAVLGCGIWVMLRALLGGLFGSSPRSTRGTIAAEMCPNCGEAWDRRLEFRSCMVCGWPSITGRLKQARGPDPALAAIRRRVERYERLGLLPKPIHDRLLEVLRAEEPPGTLARHEGLAAEPTTTASRATPDQTPAVAPEIVFLGPARPEPPVEPAASPRAGWAAPSVEAEELPSPRPGRDVRALLAAFLEEKNIRWGELVGGLLIVGCSLALVLSFWSSIAERPFLKFGLFNGFTALLFALGLHAERRWKLPTTASGLLLIATLLTPLNFLAVAALGRGEAVASAWGVAGEVLAAGLFAVLMHRAGRHLVASAPWALGTGVLIPSLVLLLVRRWVGPGGWAAPLALGAISSLAQAGAVGGLIVRTRRRPGGQESDAHELLRLLGTSAFAGALALGLILARGGMMAGALRHAAPLAPLAGMTALGSGLWLWRRTTESRLIITRVAGAAIAAAGTLLMLAGLPLGWPDPVALIAVALLNGAVLAAVALGLEVPAAYVLAGGCLAIAYLMGWSVATGELGRRGATSAEAAAALLSGRGGAALVPLVLLYGIAAGARARRGRRDDARAFALIAALVGGFSTALAAWHGFDPVVNSAGPAWVFAAYGLAALGASVWCGRFPLVGQAGDDREARALTWVGSGLTLAALIQAMAFGGLVAPGNLPWVAASLAHAALSIGLATVLSRAWGDRLGDLSVLGGVLLRAALASSGLAAALLAFAVPGGARPALAAYLLGLALVWLALAWRTASARLFAASQAALVGASAFAVAAALEERSWYIASPHPWLDPRMVQAQAIAIGVLALAWVAVRLALRRWPGVVGTGPRGAMLRRALLDPAGLSVDRALVGAVLAALVALAAYGAFPGVAQELAPRDLAGRLAGGSVPRVGRVVPPAAAFEIAGIPHAPALGAASWMLLGLTLVVLLAGQWERFRRWDLLGALLAVSLAAPLWAGRWEGEVAAASALRWAGAAVLLGLSAVVWARRPLAAWAHRLGWKFDDEAAGGLHRMVAGSAILLSLLPLAGMAAFVGIAALAGRPRPPETEHLWPATAAVSVVLAAAAIGFLYLDLTGRSAHGAGDRRRAGLAGGVLLVLAVLPLVAVTTFVVASALQGNPVVGPEPGSWFDRLGPAGSHVPPILAIAATLVGYAVRERSAGYALAACLVVDLAATVGFLLIGAPVGPAFDAPLAARLALLNAAVGSASALAWIGAVAAWRRGRGMPLAGEDDRPLAVLATLNVTLPILVLAAGIATLWFDPIPGGLHRVIAGGWGWAALLLVAGSAVARAQSLGRPLPPDGLGLGALVLAAFGAMGMTPRDAGDWLVYHGVLAGQLLAGTAMVGFAWHRSGLRLADVPGPTRGAVVRWGSLSLALATAFALRAYGADPQSPWWTVGGLAAAAGLAATLAAWSRRPAYLVACALLVNIAATVWWCDTAAWRRPAGWWPGWAALLHVNIVALAAPAPLWLWIERRFGRPGREVAPPVGRVAAWGALAASLLAILAGLGDDLMRIDSAIDAALGWLALGAATAAMAAGLWDVRARGTVAGLYLAGLGACGWAVGQFHLPPRWLAWTGTMVLAAYSVGAGFLWCRRDALRGVADRLGIPRAGAEEPLAGLRWLVPATLSLSAAVVLLAYGTILTDPDATLRALAAHAALAQGLAVGLLARGERRSRLQLAALGLGVLGAIALVWAGIPPASPTGPLDRLGVALFALVGTAALYGIGFAKVLPGATEWTLAARRLVPSLLALGGLALVAVLGSELAARAAGHAPGMSAPAVAAVALALATAVAAALVAAIVPGRDPLGLSERGRTSYVYAAEGLIAALFLHVRLSLPWLFGDVLARYGPLIVVALAFLGVGLGELFRRQGRAVLAGPLERTGAILPVLPLLAALWATPRPGEDVVFLALLGALYTTLSLLRSSAGFGALAALASNAALWAVLGRWRGLGLLEHPQLWIIPPALCVLAAGYLNRDRLTEAQFASLRSGAALAIYLASTADIVLTGVGRAPWLPLVLGGLAIVGIFAGMLLRVRGFLFLGLGFLTLAIFAIVWYAAVDLRQTWIWWASGIIAGVVILAVFAVFEKRRTEILRVVEEIRGWES